MINELDAEAVEARVLAWRRARLARLTAPDSWLSLIGKYWLRDGDNRVGSDPDCEVLLPASQAAQLGVFTLKDGAVTFRAHDGVQLSLRRAADPQLTRIDRVTLLKSDLVGAPDQLVFGSLSCEVMQRESGFAIRVRDRESATRVAFSGLEYFPIRHDLRVLARLEPYRPGKPIVLAYDGGATEHYVSPGCAIFELEGQLLRVDPVLDGNDSRLLLVFADQTNRDSSYGAGRFLYAPLPEGERVVLDFNQAFNPPCAFTPHALCPLPPLQNKLAVRIEAGEKKPREHT